MVTVATRARSRAIVKLSNIPSEFDHLQGKIYFIVLDNILFDIIIGCPTIKRFGGALNDKAERVQNRATTARSQSF